MKKALGSWSAMRKYLEQDMLATALQGRIRYGCTSYPSMDGKCMFEICIDGIQVKRFSWETVNTYFIDMGYTTNVAPMGKREYWSEFWLLLERYSMDKRSEYTDGEFCDALETYRNQDIKDSICSENVLVRMFAVLDRRVGKRTLEKIKDTYEMQPEWLKNFYKLRFEAEKI